MAAPQMAHKADKEAQQASQRPQPATTAAPRRLAQWPTAIDNNVEQQQQQQQRATGDIIERPHHSEQAAELHQER